MMNDLANKIAHLESLRSEIGDVAVDAAIAVLQSTSSDPAVDAVTVAEPITHDGVPRVSQHMVASEESSIIDSPQIAIDGDSNLLLHHIEIGMGGTLIIGPRLINLPPQSADISKALVDYLRML